MKGGPLSALLSPYVGVARALDEVMAQPGDARLPSFACDVASDERVLGVSYEHVTGASGVDADPVAAADAALGELAERYSACFIPWERLVRASAAQLGGTAVDPARFALFDQSQYARPGFPFVPFTTDLQVVWVDGWDVRTGAPAHLPAELCFLADPVAGDGPRVAYATSSGAACAPTRREAVLRGLLELCERDAFMIVWAGRLSLPLLDWARHPALRAIERRYFEPSGLSYSAVDLSRVHGLPSVLGVVRAPEHDPPSLAVGAGTAATVERAWEKALSEAFACRAAARMLRARAPERRFGADGAGVRTFDDHILFYAQPGRAGAAPFLDASPERVDVREVPPLAGSAAAQTRAVLDRIEAAGSTAYAVDVTAPDVGALGLTVVKTLAPELCMLDVAHGGRFLGGRRLTHAAAELGLAPAPLAVADLNPDPHPFP